MIFARDKGRLCNNILQYGHVYAWGREHSRATMSMRFAYKYRYFNICARPWHNFAAYVMAKYAAKWGLIPVVSFNNPDDDTDALERRMMARRNVIVEGWYVRFYDLFLKYRAEITELFDFKPAIKARVASRFAQYAAAADVVVGVHIRRGDYKTWHDGRYYYSDEDYAEAISRVAAMHPGKRIAAIVCGNAPRPDARLMQSMAGGVRLAFPSGSEADDLCMLSMCDCIIGAPSTFSLVAAMYRDLPLWWIMEKGEKPTAASFKRFDYLFRHIL